MAGYRPEKKILLYLGDTFIADINSIVQNRKLVENLKSMQTTATSDTMTFELKWKLFQKLVALKFDDDPASMLRVLKTKIVFISNGYVRFSGFLATKPARSGFGADQTLSLTFYEHFARLSGDLVCDPNNKISPMRVFTNRAAHLYAQDLISEFMARSEAAGDKLPWRFGTVNTLANKTFTYKDFQTVSKALCDAMNNVDGAGKFDIVIRTDQADYTKQIVDILAPRGQDKNIIIKYPGDGVYALWSTDYEIEETSEYASEVLISGNGQVGDPKTGENTAPIGTATNNNFASQYGYWRSYSTQSNLSTNAAVQAYAKTELSQKDFGLEAPKIKLKGRPIEWGNAGNLNNGLAIGDTFYFKDESDSSVDQSGRVRIIGLETTYDNVGAEIVTPQLLRA